MSITDRERIIRPAREPIHGYRITRKGRVVRRILRSLGLLLLVLGIAGGGLFLYTQAKINGRGVLCPSCSATQDPGGAMNVLVLGSDSRAVLDPQDLQHYDPLGADRSSGQRADSIVLLHVDPRSARAVAVALPRDLRVKSPNGQYAKINGFYNQGVSAMVQAVQTFTGLPVNHYVEINFNSFRTVTDALGGVNVRFTRAVNDPDSGLKQPRGCNLLKGDQALAFVRVRHIDSDFGRIARQQLFVKLMMDKVLSAGTLLNPVKVLNLVNLGLGSVTHDSGLGLSAMQSLAVRFRHFSANDIDFRVVPSTPQMISGTDFVVANQAQSAALFAALRNGTPLPDYGRQGVSALDASEVQATILNGTRAPGVAARAASELRARGYSVLATTNADRADYASTVVYYRPGGEQKAQLLSQVFPEAPVEALPPAIKVTTGDAVVVLGSDYVRTGASTPPKGSLSPSASSGTTVSAGPPVSIQTSVPWFSAC
ncbi:MAG TPA: LCP family protein [Acidimicrobiia bacterium]|nr:LCP family protein [Acidimicrobiia bacterium]